MKFIIKDESANDFYADVVLSDKGEYQIFNYEKTSTIFDEYNEIIVFGASSIEQQEEI